MAASGVYYIWGEEEYLVEQEVGKIIGQLQQTSGEELERVVVDADELDAMGLARALEFSPLFALNRVVIIRRPAWLGKSNRKNKKIDEVCQVLSDSWSQGEGQTIIITAAERNATNPVVKLLEREARVIHCQTLDSKQLSRWISDEFARRQRRVTQPAIALLVKSGLDMYYLQNLIEKLGLIVSDRDITEKDVQEQFTLRQDINVFKLIDSLMSRDLVGAMNAYRQLLVQGEHQVFMLYMIIRQFSIMAQVKCHKDNGLTTKQTAAITSQKEFVVRKMWGKCSQFTQEEIKDMFALFLEADISFKTTGKSPGIVMELLITKICSA